MSGNTAVTGAAAASQAGTDRPGASSGSGTSGAIIASLEQRLAALEADNARLAREVAILTGQDGVLARMIAHIRALQGQDEAVRREIISLLDEAGTETPNRIESELPTRARHSLVTEIAPAEPESGTVEDEAVVDGDVD